jgi:hypothetical protein
VRQLVRDIVVDLSEERPKTRAGEPYRDWEYDKRITVVDVSGAESIKGLVYVDNKYVDHNILTSWFWAMIIGLLADSSVSDVVSTGGVANPLLMNQYSGYGSAWMSVGSSDIAESFLDINLRSYVKNLATTITLGSTSSDSRVTLTATTDVDTKEVGVFQNLYYATYSYTAYMYARKVVYVPAGKTITWSLTFSQPWSKRMAELMYGIFRYANSGIVRTDGTIFTARTTGDVNAGRAYLVYSSTQVTWSPDLYAVPNAQGLSMMYWDAFNQRSFRLWGLLGSITPGTDVTVNTLGIYQPIYDTSGVAQTVCLAVLPLSTPVTFYANRVNLVMLRIVAA